MVRLGSVALIVLSLPAAAWSNPPSTIAAQGQNQSFDMPRTGSNYGIAPDGNIGRAEIAPNAYFGFGIFGLKSEKSHLRPVTVREIDAPKQRRPAIGFSLKF